ncbi:ThuA domain-containing protein [Dyadobacter sp. CY356]|uniref:ThuA domain-containing protein n=1 Tax=Dyadobacter sp. CY356 TaxID=2906442 RepID=UPI001F1F31E6|nr:ThuA domain-containing protein [Dyadobacter sp. CY356]MCF0054506.1 ThuA domain-containing protein [Dyadobacter sp. CY356]
MKKNFKILLLGAGTLMLILVAAASLFIYRIKNGFPVKFETDQPVINFPSAKPSILLFSKTTGYRHSESIDAAKRVFLNMSEKNGWYIYETEEGGVFTSELLKHFKVIIINNGTGRLLNAEQQMAVKHFVESGGTLMGIHGAGDFSHDDWPWMNKNLIGASFSHHPLHPQLQSAQVNVEKGIDSTFTRQLPASWKQTDEWYIYYSKPKDAKIVAFINGEKILPSGNIFLMNDKDFGMGKYHPVAWYRNVGQGKTFYTSMGHDKAVWQNNDFVNLLQNAVYWSLK